MNILSREKQIEIIAALCEGVGQRAVTPPHWHRPKDSRPAGAPRRSRLCRTARPNDGRRPRPAP